MEGVTDDARYAGLERVTAVTGGQKERRAARFDLLPWGALWRVAEVYGHGAGKYEDHNWRRGIPVSTMIGAAGRHLAAIAEGEDFDPESGLPHAAHLAFHALGLIDAACTVGARPAELDDRWRGVSAWPPGAGG